MPSSTFSIGDNWSPVPPGTFVESEFQGIRFRRLDLMALEPLAPLVAVGIDPGQVNMGLAVLYGSTACVYEATLPAETEPINRIMLAAHAVQYILSETKRQPQIGCVEGAAYLAGAGQVPLDENRVTAAITLMQGGLWPVVIAPPARIREKVFGNGRLRAQEIWPKLPENAMSAFGCALYIHKVISEEHA